MGEMVPYKRFGTKPFWNCSIKVSYIRFGTKPLLNNFKKVPHKRFGTEPFWNCSIKVPYRRFGTKPLLESLTKVSYNRFGTKPLLKSLKKVPYTWFRTKPSRAYSAHERALPTDKSFSSWAPLHEVDPREISKIPKGCFQLGLPSKLMIILLELQPNAHQGTHAGVKSVSVRTLCAR